MEAMEESSSGGEILPRARGMKLLVKVFNGGEHTIEVGAGATLGELKQAVLNLWIRSPTPPRASCSRGKSSKRTARRWQTAESSKARCSSR